MDLKNLTIKKAHEALRKGDFTAVELTKAYLDNIAAKNKDLNAYLEVFDDAIEQAEEADRKIQDSRFKIQDSETKDQEPNSGDRDFPMLLGIPCAIKDNILIKGRIASSASKILENYHATYDATVITKLKAAGAVFLGRTNMDEFAMGGSTENSAFGPTKNPHDPARVAGGSSGGSAAAVAMDGALFALGSDTGGSIRQPASFCGVVGLKPTYGSVSRYGVMAMGSSLDQIGPITKSVDDAEIVYDAIRGEDKGMNGGRGDGTMVENSKFKIQNSKFGGKKPVIGVPRHFLTGDGIDKEVLEAFDAALDSFKAQGYGIKEIELPNISYALPVYYVIMPAEVSSNMARFDGVKYGLHKDGNDGIDDYFETRKSGLGREVIRRILLGTYVLSSGYYDAYYNRANAVRRMIADDFLKAFDPAGGGVDLIATPTTPSPAFKIGEKTADPVAMYLEDIFTVTANLTGMPAISIPMNLGEESNRQVRAEPHFAMPTGLQLTARHGDEAALFRAASDFASER
ncbi:MAG: Asp-tRNA(Asn)/Glu-tRNA(Gln) amidotransferase subunit GatA [Patescibacteria group bacterium]|nr:Asp-tRNA(Asn)/Glu-tRNA(Gln) amidotransferase subunit GatA [Patescibacteria group bacterium]